MRLPASGKARFGLGFWPIVGFFVLANLVTVVVEDKVGWDFLSAFIGGHDPVGFPFDIRGIVTVYGKQQSLRIGLALNAIVCFVPATFLGFVLYKFGDPKRGLGYLCKGCGYDLRGIPVNVCPECGANAQRSDEPSDP